MKFTLKEVVALCLLANACSSGSEVVERRKRYLIYEDGGPARAQFIFGVGIPVATKRQSVTVGSVFKFQYDLPTNSSEYTTRFYDFANTVSRRIHKDRNDVNDDSNSKQDVDNDITENDSEEIELNSDSDSEDNSKETDDADTLVDIHFDDKRKKRAITKLSNGVNLLKNDVRKDSEKITLEEAIELQEQKELNLKRKYEIDDEEPLRFNRWHFYKILEQMAERHGFTGRPCLLRSICEASEVPFTYHNGLLGEIVHILLTPSSTADNLTHHTDNEYHAAERLGREASGRCEDLFPDCESSILETFTQVGLSTLSKFGL